jgi:hypothetical protein
MHPRPISGVLPKPVNRRLNIHRLIRPVQNNQRLRACGGSGDILTINVFEIKHPFFSSGDFPAAFHFANVNLMQ